MAGPRVFLSYSRRDEPVLKSLLPFLATLEREGLIAVWSDRQIRTGEVWRAQIDEALEAATIAVLLVSQEFLASPFIRDEELPRILERQMLGRMTVLPVFVSPSTVTSDSVTVRDAQGVERRIALSELQGFGSPSHTLSELELAERQRCFVDLHDRIRELANSPSQSIPPAPPQRPRISRIPFPRNRAFTGREEYLRSLHEQLASGKPAAVTQALAGLGGIGKTQLALEYSYRFGGEYDVLWWIRAENADTRLDDLRALGRALGIDAGSDPSRLADATLEWLDRSDDWLLVFDNAERLDDIRNLLPRSGRGRIIITSRNPAWGEVAKTVNLGVWTPQEAASYLSHRTGLPEGADAAAIAESLGYLPLALSQAASYIDETGCGFAGYLALLQARPVETLKLRRNATADEKAVAVVWDIAFERVAASSPAAIALLNLFAFLPPDRIPRPWLIEHADRLPSEVRSTVEDPFALDAAIGALRSYSLVDTSGDAFSLHRLVQAVVRGRLDNDAHRTLFEAAKDLETTPSEPVALEPRRQGMSTIRRRYMVIALVIAVLGLVVTAILRERMQQEPVPQDTAATGTPARTSSGATASAAEPVVVPPITNAASFNFDGFGDPKLYPPSPSGAAGPHHYVHTASHAFAVYDKTGKELLAPAPIESLWKGHGGNCENDDIFIGLSVVYDHLADRWLLSHTTTKAQCLAVSKTSDPTRGGWYLYSFDVPQDRLDDYPKLAVWPDAYYLGSYSFAEGKLADNAVWVFEREAMLQGKRARHLRMRGDDGGYLMPADLDGPPAPEGTPAFLLRYIDAPSGGKDHLELFAMHISWSGSSTMKRIASIETDPFDTNQNDYISQPGTDTPLQVIGDRIMWPVQYRNFGSYETLVANHTVLAGGKVAGVRWYELRRSGGGEWSMFQQGTVAPDNLHRWLGSIAMDSAGDIVLGYSVSGIKTPPGIRYVSRRRDDPRGSMGREMTILDGRGSTESGRWGANSSMTVDPAEPCTFWFTTEYLPVSGDFKWRTRIARIRPPGC